MTVIRKFLDAKYLGGGPDSSRFEPDAKEVHASDTSVCQRLHWFRGEYGRKNEASPYFELGRTFELLYGGALAYEHDENVTTEVLHDNHPWEVAWQSDVIQQDVTMTIELRDGPAIVGESDWCVLNEGGNLESVTLHSDGTRTEVFNGEEREYQDTVAKVVETKTTKDLSYAKGGKPKHKYQLYSYMKTFDAKGELAYMTRNEWDELVVPIELSDEQWLDVELRARKLSEVMKSDEVPAATPLTGNECHWCNFKSECRKNGGSQYV